MAPARVEQHALGVGRVGVRVVRLGEELEVRLAVDRENPVRAEVDCQPLSPPVVHGLHEFGVRRAAYYHHPLVPVELFGLQRLTQAERLAVGFRQVRSLD
jgi:hypothetical protein